MQGYRMNADTAGQSITLTKGLKKTMTQDAPSQTIVMTPFPYAVSLNVPIDDAERLIAEHDIHHLPVKGRHDIVGIVTSRDLMSARSGNQRRRELRIEDAFVKDIDIVDLREPLANVVSTMANRHIASVIVTRQGRLARVLAWVDARRRLGALLWASVPPVGDDDAA